MWRCGWLAAVLLCAACDRFDAATRHLHASPHQQYERALRRTGLDDRELGERWLSEAETSLSRAVVLTPPYREVGWFAADTVRAAGWRVAVKLGQRVSVELTTPPETRGAVFIDVFEAWPDGRRKRLEGGAASASFEIDAEASGELVLRVQPELLAAGRYELTVRIMPSLRFPVAGRSSEAVQSGFGAPRDGGRRTHHGIDIFAPRGTQVVAAAAGIVASTRETVRGGKVVWVQSRRRMERHYYAHLDRVDVVPGEVVAAGEVLGTVGNSGNARGTPPHLHFGIYHGLRGAVDPLPFVEARGELPPRLQASLDVLGKTVRLPAGAAVHAAAAAGRPSALRLEHNAVVMVLAAAGNAYRVATPGNREGFVAADKVLALERPLRTVRLARTRSVRAEPKIDAAEIAQLQAGTELVVHGQFDGFTFVEARSGTTIRGWLPPERG